MRYCFVRAETNSSESLKKVQIVQIGIHKFVSSGRVGNAALQYSMAFFASVGRAEKRPRLSPLKAVFKTPTHVYFVNCSLLDLDQESLGTEAERIGEICRVSYHYN